MDTLESVKIWLYLIPVLLLAWGLLMDLGNWYIEKKGLRGDEPEPDPVKEAFVAGFMKRHIKGGGKVPGQSKDAA